MSKFAELFKGNKEKKPLTPTQQKLKLAGNWIVGIICVVIILLALAVSVMTLTRTQSEAGVANVFGSAFMPVQTDSMEPTIKVNDMIVTKMFKGVPADLQVGQVVAYSSLVQQNGQMIKIYKTHRIQEVKISTDGKYSYLCVGDNPNPKDGGSGQDLVPFDNIVATWGKPAPLKADGTFDINKDNMGSNMGQIGKAVNWLQQDRTNYFLVIVLPLILMFVIYAFILVRTLVIAKLNKTKEEAKNQSIEGLSDEDKRRLAEEYLAKLREEESQAAQESADEAPQADDNQDAQDADCESTVEEGIEG